MGRDSPRFALTPVPETDIDVSVQADVHLHALSASPRYACGVCERVLISGLPLSEWEREVRAGDRRRYAIRCGCGALNTPKVSGGTGPPDLVARRRSRVPDDAWVLLALDDR